MQSSLGCEESEEQNGQLEAKYCRAGVLGCGLNVAGCFVMSRACPVEKLFFRAQKHKSDTDSHSSAPFYTVSSE